MPIHLLIALFPVVCFELLITQTYFDLPRRFKLSESTVRKVRKGGRAYDQGYSFLLQVDWPPGGYLGHSPHALKSIFLQL